MEWLHELDERTERRHHPEASSKQHRANRCRAGWSFADLQGLPVIYVDADYTSQGCPVCGHAGKENRPGQGLHFGLRPPVSLL